MMVIPGWDVAVQANWGFVRVRWLSHAAVGILIPSQFRTVLQIEQIETIDWHVCGICLDDLDAALRLLCQRLLVYKMDIFSVTMSGLAVRIEITFLQTTRNYTNSTSSAWTSATSCAIQIPWVQADSSSFSLSSVQLSIVSPCFIEYCKRTMGKFASTCQAVERLFHKLEYVGIPTCFHTCKIFEVVMNGSVAQLAQDARTFGSATVRGCQHWFLASRLCLWAAVRGEIALS